MTVKEFTREMCLQEAGRGKQVNIANMAEIIKNINESTCGILYMLIRDMEKPKEVVISFSGIGSGIGW